MDLIILRHGEAGKSMESAGADFERALTVSGAIEVEEVVEAMGKLKLGINHVISSPLKRANETAIIAARGLKKEDLLELWDELKPEGDTQDLYRRLSKLRQDSVVLLVGHEPYLSGMIGELISGTKQARIILKKAGVARVEVTSLVPRPSGELRWLLTPRQMKKIA
ncbi:MAG: phosphohistidine phosphatase SixA [Thaumarchaeota archaeon]|nr:phosphohistidine phosphatase SixA [Nitrososphaerota archaeon]